MPTKTAQRPSNGARFIHTSSPNRTGFSHPNRCTAKSASNTDLTESSHPHLKCPSGQRLRPCLPQGRQGNSVMASTTTYLDARGPNPNRGTVLVNNATVGVFVAVATCKGAVVGHHDLGHLDRSHHAQQRQFACGIQHVGPTFCQALTKSPFVGSAQQQNGFRNVVEQLSELPLRPCFGCPLGAWHDQHDATGTSLFSFTHMRFIGIKARLHGRLQFRNERINKDLCRSTSCVPSPHRCGMRCVNRHAKGLLAYPRARAMLSAVRTPEDA